MLGEFVDEYTVKVMDVFAMPQVCVGGVGVVGVGVGVGGGRELGWGGGALPCCCAQAARSHATPLARSLGLG